MIDRKELMATIYRHIKFGGTDRIMIHGVDEAADAILGKLGTAPADLGFPFKGELRAALDRLNEAAYRDSAKSITVSARDLRLLLAGTAGVCDALDVALRGAE